MLMHRPCCTAELAGLLHTFRGKCSQFCPCDKRFELFRYRLFHLKYKLLFIIYLTKNYRATPDRERVLPAGYSSTKFLLEGTYVVFVVCGYYDIHFRRLGRNDFWCCSFAKVHLASVSFFNRYSWN